MYTLVPNAKMCAMIGLKKIPRLLVSVLVALQYAATAHGMTIVLHPQGVLEVPQNATAAVVCRVQHDSGQKIFTVFTWDGEPLQVGHRHLNSGLLDVSFTRCVTDAGHICEEFTLTVKGVSAANGSIVGCCSTNFSAEFRADGHVQITVIDSISGTSVAPSPTPTITIVASPSLALGSTSSGTGTDMTIDITPSPTVSRGSTTEGVLSMMLVTALLAVIVAHLL